MKKYIFFVLLSACLTACNWHPMAKLKEKMMEAAAAKEKEKEKAASANGQPAASGSQDQGAAQLIDTAKLKSDLNAVVSSMASDKPDTTRLKEAGSDILSTTSKVLSDSGIDKLYGNDPAAKQAAAMLKKMRNSMGITPDKLDSIQKAAQQLKDH